MEQKFPKAAVPGNGTVTVTRPDSVSAAFATHGIVRQLRRGVRLFSTGDPVPGLHLVDSGHLRIVVGGAKPVVVHYEGPGGMLGETALFGGVGYPASAIATEPTVCRLLPRASVMRLLSEDGEAAAFFLARLATRLRGVITRLSDVNQTRVAVRLSRHLADRPGAASGRKVSLGMTQAELAEELGTVREVVVRELRRLCERQLVASAGRGLYRVTDIAALRAIAETGE